MWAQTFVVASFGMASLSYSIGSWRSWGLGKRTFTVMFGGIIITFSIAVLMFLAPLSIGYSIIYTSSALVAFSSSISLLYSTISLGESFHISPYQYKRNTPLKTSGPYRLVRHPIYLSECFLWPSLSIPLIISTLSLINILTQHSALIALGVAGGLWILMVTASYHGIRDEERILEKRFGDAYKEYKKKVKWALLPFDNHFKKIDRLHNQSKRPKSSG